MKANTAIYSPMPHQHTLPSPTPDALATSSPTPFPVTPSSRPLTKPSYQQPAAYPPFHPQPGPPIFSPASRTNPSYPLVNFVMTAMTHSSRRSTSALSNTTSPPSSAPAIGPTASRPLTYRQQSPCLPHRPSLLITHQPPPVLLPLRAAPTR